MVTYSFNLVDVVDIFILVLFVCLFFLFLFCTFILKSPFGTNKVYMYVFQLSSTIISYHAPFDRLDFHVVLLFIVVCRCQQNYTYSYVCVTFQIDQLGYDFHMLKVQNLEKCDELHF